MGRRSRLFGGSDNTALWSAAKKLDDPRVRELLLKDPTSSELNRAHPAQGTTPLMVACSKKRLSGADNSKCAQVVQHLLEFGADLDLVDQTEHKNTALHYAAYSNAAIAIEYLLHAGANAFVLNQKGHTALDVARLRGRKQATAILTQHLAIKSGWLEMNASSILPIWKRRWCVVLACNLERTRFEVCLFPSPSDLLPDQVLHIDSAARAEFVTGSTKGIFSWMTKPYMFTLDRPLVHQGVAGRRFNRDRVTGLTHGQGPVEVKKVVFASESESIRHAWMVQLGNGSQHLSLSPSAYQQPYTNMPVGIDTPQRRNSLLPPRHSVYESHAQLLPTSAPAMRNPVAYATEVHSFSNFSPPPRQHLESPTTVVYGFASPAARSPPPSAPSFRSEEPAHYRGPGSYVSTLEASLAAAASTPSAPNASFILDENVAPNHQLPDASSAAGYAQPQPSMQAPAKSGVGSGDCVICMDAMRDAICVPCGHIASCYKCLSMIKQQSGNQACCPICRSLVATVVKIYEC